MNKTEMVTYFILTLIIIFSKIEGFRNFKYTSLNIKINSKRSFNSLQNDTFIISKWKLLVFAHKMIYF